MIVHICLLSPMYKCMDMLLFFTRREDECGFFFLGLADSVVNVVGFFLFSLEV